MSKPLRILLVDDKKDYCESLSGVARHNNIQLEYKLDWETGFELLRNDPTIEFVILDGKGKIEADQEVEKDNFALRAIKDLDAYAMQIGKHIPYCVNTGFIDRFESFEGNVQIYEKKDEDRDKMFTYIAQEIAKSDYRTARLKYEEPFRAFDKGIVSNTYEHLLVKIIQAYEAKDFRKRNINVQRDLLEAIYIGLNNPIPCIPNGLFKDDGKPNHEWCTRFMEDRETNGNKLNKAIPQDIKSAFRKLKESTNRYSHIDDNEILKAPFSSNKFLLIEILEWLPIFVENNYKNYL
ncbi:hypothetical protein [Winogradskyella arenosi]|uniref:Uncharacterized protein n=1 Tax=Winogradskyella arenosi TaxID=533325 RepID=A0A368ZIK7_9FLAO|nr:hypothetical protein [Winogradskyella arenosi]RCW93622.1 hypothetical protein DFQ08_101419 [Winogradskyella arenosi]